MNEEDEDGDVGQTSRIFNGKASCYSRILFSIFAFDEILLDQMIDSLLDIWNLGLESGRDLLNGLLHQSGMLHGLTRLHDTVDRE